MRKHSELLTTLAAAALLIAAPAPQTLRHAADRTHILVGTAVRPSLLQEPAYAETLSREYNMIEPEDVMKWWVVRRDRDKFDFTQGDELVSFAHAHGMKVRGHCLVWDHDNPDWLAHGNFAPAQLSDLLRKHITTEVEHYAGQVFAWDVVNEAFEEHGKLRDSIWYNRPGIGDAEKGTAYIERAFRWAHEADPSALLFYNEAEAEEMNAKSDAVYGMLKDFKQRGAPVAGIGLQFHVFEKVPDLQSVAKNMARFAALGLQIHITELDVSLPVDPQADLLHPEDIARQAQIYRGIAIICLENPYCTAIQTWGFTDKYSWIGSFTRHSRGWALPFDRNYQPKPAYRVLEEELEAGRIRHD